MPPIDKPLPARPKPTPKPAVRPPSAPMAALPHGAGTLSTPRPAAPRPASAYTTPAPRTTVPEARPHGTGTLTRVTPGATQPRSAYANPQSYAATVLHVFNTQSPAQQRAVIRGALKAPDTAESKILLQYIRQQHPPATGGRGLAAIVSPGAVAPSAFASAGGTVNTITANALKDVINLPAETFSTIGTIGGDVLTGHPVKAVKAVVDPFVQLAEHPVRTFEQHPLDTALMVAGPLHGLTRIAAAPVRALAPESAVGRAISTERPSVALTGKLTHERPPYSKSPTVKAGQAAVEKLLYKRNEAGELVPRSPHVRQRQIRQGVGELIGTRERIRVANRQAVRDARESAVRASLPKRAATAARTALAYGPRRATIPGADVLARIADATVRRPDTIREDLLKHTEQVAANRPNLLDDPKALKTHDAYVKAIVAAAENRKLMRSPDRAFKAAEAYAKDYPIVEAQARGLGHFGSMTDELLQRRTLAHFAATHMGAKIDEATGQLVDAAGKPLSNGRIVAELNHPTRGTGGRMPTYTPDRIHFDREQRARSAAYVSSERRPLPMTKKNTLYAYTHGLTGPGHEALTQQHMLMRGVLDAHHAQNAYAETLALSKHDGSYWGSFQAAKRDAPSGYRPINLSQPFHPRQSLDQALQDVSPTSIEDETLRHSLDLSARLEPGQGNRWGIIRNESIEALQQAQQRISPDSTLKAFRGLNNQFRTVALSTSAKHVPGVAQENVIRDIAHGVGFRSWITGRRMLAKVEELRPERGRDIRTSLTGGQVAGMTEAGKTYLVSEHWQGTNAYPFLKAFEAAAKTPGLKQMRTAWRAWTRFAIGTTKHMLEQQHQIAGLGKAALREHGYAEAARTAGFMGLARRAFALHGQMLEDAAKGLFDPAKLRQTRATINQMYGKWTDLSPGAQTALMFSPFGLWWVNSARFLMRMPIDQPVKTGLLAAATVGTQQQRQAQGLDMFSPGGLPPYEQGGIPVGGKILAQNYYSPFGIANDPLSTGQSLIQPWLFPIMSAALPNAVNWLGKPLSAPGQNTNRGNEKTPSKTQQAQAIINSILSSFVPLYTKAQQVAEGGASPYDVTPPSIVPPLLRGRSPATKKPGGGPLAGLEKAVQPFRTYKKAGGQGAYRLGGGSQSAAGGGYVLGSGSQSSGGSKPYVLGSGGG